MKIATTTTTGPTGIPDEAAPVVTIHPAAEGGYTVHGPDGVHTQGETLTEAVAALAEALSTIPAEPVSDPAPSPTTAAPIEGSVAAVGGPSEPLLSPLTVGSPEGRAMEPVDPRPSAHRLVLTPAQSAAILGLGFRAGDDNEIDWLIGRIAGADRELAAIDKALGYGAGCVRSEGDRVRAVVALLLARDDARSARDAANERADLAEQARKEAVAALSDPRRMTTAAERAEARRVLRMEGALLAYLPNAAATFEIRR